MRVCVDRLCVVVFVTSCAGPLILDYGIRTKEILEGILKSDFVSKDPALSESIRSKGIHEGDILIDVVVNKMLGAAAGKTHLDGIGVWSLLFRPTATGLGLGGWQVPLPISAGSVVLLTPTAAHWGLAQNPGQKQSLQVCVNVCECVLVFVCSCV